MSFTRKRSREGRHDDLPAAKRDRNQVGQQQQTRGPAPKPATNAFPPQPRAPTPNQPSIHPSLKKETQTTSKESEEVVIEVKTNSPIESLNPIPSNYPWEAQRGRLLSLTDNIRTLATSLVERSLSVGVKTAGKDEEVKKMIKNGFLALIELKGVHRTVQREVEIVKDKSITCGSNVVEMELQNMKSAEYETKMFKSIVETEPSLSEAVGLLSPQEFQEKSKGTPFEATEKDGEHRQVLKRLKMEVENRNELNSKLNQIPIRQDALKSELMKEKRQMDKVKQVIKDMSNQMKVMKANVDTTNLKPVDPTAAWLSQPLYNFYIQIQSWISIFESTEMELSISGSLEAAKRQPSRDLSVLPLSTQLAQKTHPLSLLLTISPNITRKIGFRIEYLYNLNIVTITPMNNDDPRILDEIHENDCGNISPDWSISLILDPTTPFLSPRSRAYKWLQSLCGLHFPPGPTPIENIPSQSEIQNFIPKISLTDTMALILRRARNFVLLKQVIQSMSNGNFPIEFSSHKSPSIPQQQQQQQPVTMKRFTENTTAQAQAILKDIVTYWDSERSKGNVSVPSVCSPSAWYCSTSFTLGSPKDTVHLLVELSPNFPDVLPRYWLSATSKEISSSRLLLLNNTSPELSIIERPNPPQQILSLYVTWIRDCLNLLYFLQHPEGKESQLATLENPFETLKWNNVN